MFPKFSKHKLILVCIDACAIIAGFTFGFWFVFGSGIYREFDSYPIYFIPSVILAVAIFLMAFQLKGLYKYQSIKSPIHQIQSILQSFLTVLAAFILIIFFMKTKLLIDSRFTIGISFLVSFLLMAMLRVIIVHKAYLWLLRKKIIKKRVLIIGAGEQGQLVCRYIHLNPQCYFEVLGFCDDDPAKVGRFVQGVPVVGTSHDLEYVVKKMKVEETIIAISRIEKSDMLDLIDRCKQAGGVIHVISDLYRYTNEKLQVEEYGGLQTYRILPHENGFLRDFFWRAFNLTVSGILLVIIAPLFCIIAIAIKRDSYGPVFYKSKVIGKNGKPFWAYKFRSMYTESRAGCDKNQSAGNAAVDEGRQRHLDFMKSFIQGETGDECYVKNEHRITPVGRILRKYSLDELPQLINVIRGEMNLVGPRFCTVEEYAFYKPWHKRRFSVKPALTGLWQVSARSECSYDDMVFLDLYYIENRSLFFDIEILLRTIPVVLLGKGSRIKAQRPLRLEDKIKQLELANGRKIA